MTKKHSKNINQFFPLAILSLVLALALLLFKNSITNPPPQPLHIAEITNPTGSVTLSLTSPQLILQPHDTTQISLQANAGTENISAIDFKLTFDPNMTELSNLTPHPDLSTVLRPPIIDQATGTLTFASGIALASQTPLTGNITLATFTLKALNSGSSALTLSPEIMIATKERTTNALKEINNLVLTIADNSSPSATPSSSPSTEPSIIPSLTPSPDPSDPPVAKPNSPVNLKYNCYNNGTRITLRWDAVTSATSYEVTLDQKDGDHNQTKTTSRSEIDLDVRGNTLYSWKVASINNNGKSDPATVNELKCNSTNNNPSPTPITTPTPTKKPLSQVIKNAITPKSPTPTPSPSTTFSPSYPSVPMASPGSLSDIFKNNPDNQTSSNPTDLNQPSLFTKIILGWKAIFFYFLTSL